MKTLRTTAALAAILTGLTGVGVANAEDAKAGAQLNGRWDAVLTRNGLDIPFRLDIKGEGQTLEGIFYDGWDAYDGTTSATFKDGHLVLNIEHYLTTIDAKLEGKELVGAAVAQNRETSAQYTFRAVRHVPPKPTNVKAPKIAGEYVIPLETPSSKGEKAFRLIARQKGAEVAASILRIDGDTGSYSGTFKDGKWILSHFDGGRPGVIEVTPKADGTLEVVQRSDRAPAAATTSDYGRAAAPDGRYAPTLVAYKAEVAKAKGLPEPDNALTHTTIRDPNEIFKFSFPNLDGKPISSDDPEFKGKVVVAIVTGTWCPNCHDEAQYLVQLDKKYRDKGLKIVALTFEEPEQHAELDRARAFVKEYGIEYTYLLAGAPAEMWEKAPQLNHLDTWPATLFVGRDGKIDAVHSGFASPASASYHDQLKQDFETRIERLLAAAPQLTEASNASSAGSK